MIVLGIDPGTATTGYGLVREQERGPALVAYGVITTPAGMPMPQRLLLLYRGLRALLEEHKPDTGAVEKLFFQRNVTTAMAVGQARGIALMALAEAGLSVGEYTPMEIKQAISGYGGADKRQMQAMVQALLNLADVPRPDDAADALAVAICHMHAARLNLLIG